MILQDPDTEILHKCPDNRDLVQVLLQDPDTSGPRDPHTHTEILKHRSCTSCPTGSWYSGPTGSRYSGSKGSWYRDFAQVVLEDPDTSGPKDPGTEILYKWSYRILIQVVQKYPHTEILKHRSCTSCPTGSWYSGPTGSRYSGSKGSWYRDFAQVVLEDPDTCGPKDPGTEILYKWSYRILIQVVQKYPHTEILKHRSCTSCPTGSWYRDLAQVRL